MSLKYYAVVKGKGLTPNIYTTWKECSDATSKVKGAIFKSFSSQQEAIKFIERSTGKKYQGKRYKETLNPKPIKPSEKEKLEVFRELSRERTSSMGENVVETHLKLMNYEYKKEFKINIGGVEYRFDFAILDNGKLIGFIEYDGVQHYRSVEKFGGEKGLKSTQYRDSVKNNYCKAQNLKLLRIKYTENPMVRTMLSEMFPISSSRIIQTSRVDELALPRVGITMNILRNKYGVELTNKRIADLHKRNELNSILSEGNHPFIRVEVRGNKLQLVTCEKIFELTLISKLN